MTDRLLASDLDGTLIPNETAEEYTRAVAVFSEQASRPGAPRIAYATGRRSGLAMDAIADLDLPLPDFLASDVGTSVWIRSGDLLVPDHAYDERMRAAMAGTTAADVAAALDGIDGLRLQAPAAQSDVKISFDFPEERRDEVVGAVRERLDGRPLSVVVSHDPYVGGGLLDVLPGSVAKDTAVEYLRERLGLERERVCYAGDSGNDVAAMLAGYRAIVVANAPEAVKDEIRSEAESRQLTEGIYFAHSRYTAGVVEGCRHWGLFGDA